MADDLEQQDQTADPATPEPAVDDPTTPEPLNREQRRAARFRPNANQPDPHAVGGPVPNEPADLIGNDQDALTRSGSGDETRLTGAGTGGATESGTRQPHHEGAHFGNQPNS
jgi:hypothetical protein